MFLSPLQKLLYFEIVSLHFELEFFHTSTWLEINLLLIESPSAWSEEIQSLNQAEDLFKETTTVYRNHRSDETILEELLGKLHKTRSRLWEKIDDALLLVGCLLRLHRKDDSAILATLGKLRKADVVLETII